MPDTSLDPARLLRTPDWYRGATRWTQLTLAEDDPVKFSVEEWIDVFRRTGSNATCLSAGGYVAYYPTEVPFHYRSKWLGDTDPFGALVEGARSLDMHVMARVDPHAIHDDAAAAHPEWVAVDAEGQPRRHWAYPDIWVTCAYGDYNTEYMPQIVREIVRNYDIDAVFANRWQGHGICYCDACKTRFKAASGFDLPRVTDPADASWRAWVAWRRERLTQMVVRWDREVQAIRPNASFIPNMGGASLMEFDLATIEAHCPFLVVDHQGRHGLEPLWMAGRNAKRIRATFRDRPVVLITSVGPEEPVHRWKDSVTTGPEMTAWIADGAGHGMLPWFTKFNGVIPDRRWIEPIAQGFDLHARIEPALAATQPACEIAILDATTTLRLHDLRQRDAAEADEKGFCHALVEAGLAFEFVSDHAMTPDMLDRFKVLILPNARCLSDDQCRMIEDWARRGGNLVVAGESALAYEDGTPRDECGLATVLGTRVAGPTRGPLKNTYVQLAGEHPVNEGYQGARRIIGGLRLTAVAAEPDTQAPFLAVPDFPDLPMEEVYPREEATAPAVVTRETAAGRSVHIPWNIGATFWEVLAQDHQRLIENAVRWVLGGPSMVEIEGRGLFDIGVREAPGERLVTLMNLTNPMAWKPPIREIFPSGPQEVSIALDPGARNPTARLLVSGQDVPVTVQGGRAMVTVPQVDILEAVHLTWQEQG
ncbi:family 10 glycosylhydrolase [Halodurantibacterium flavum]|uniref:Family 10 glycosylhydrolase n=1 Tax=Halodurantibacterium flavum TaxID=1382802 RepID=A0ABW4S1P2_9RHOB